MESSKITTIGSITAAIVASLCCIGPVVVAVIGVGSIGAFAVFEPYRPYVIGVTIILLGIAFYLTYRKREVICQDGSCKIESAGRWNKIAMWLATGLVALAIAFPYLDFTDAEGAQAMLSRGVIRSSHSAVAVLKIEGMDCAGCAKGLEATLARSMGVKKAAVDFDQSTAVVEYDPTKVTRENLVAYVDETGFKSTLVKPSEIKH